MSDHTVVILAVGATRPLEVIADARTLSERGAEVVIATRRPVLFDEIRALPGVELIHVAGVDARRLLRLERRLLQAAPRRLYFALMKRLDAARATDVAAASALARMLQAAIHRAYFVYIRIVQVGDRLVEARLVPKMAAIAAEVQGGKVAASAIRNRQVVGLVSSDLQSLRPAWVLAKTHPTLPVTVGADPEWLPETGD